MGSSAPDIANDGDAPDFAPEARSGYLLALLAWTALEVTRETANAPVESESTFALFSEFHTSSGRDTVLAR